MKDVRFQAHNSHWEAAGAFAELDPSLRRLRSMPLVYRYPLLEKLPVDRPGIYSITGGRQIGKTTVMKQWMHDLLQKGADPRQIAFFTGELIDDHHTLVQLTQEFTADTDPSRPSYLLIDEITYVRDWDKAVKYLADSGGLDNVVLLLSGSDSTIIREARARFPGRRGNSEMPDYHLFPLSFFECFNLKEKPGADVTARMMDRDTACSPEITSRLMAGFEAYLVHGGYLTAINDMVRGGAILPSTLSTYADWIRGDMMKRGKQERYLKEILDAVVLRYGSQITWNNLAHDLSIDHPMTVADYISLLSAMDAVFIQPALMEHRLMAAPKKARKVMFCDPFIFHAVRGWLRPERDPYRSQILPCLSDPEWCGRLVEACVATHIGRFFPTFYIKAEGEVDVAWVQSGKMHPVEVKWTGQLRPKKLAQIRKYRNGAIWSRLASSDAVAGVEVQFLPLALYRLGPSPATAP
jgi:uncharacterized protein